MPNRGAYSLYLVALMVTVGFSSKNPLKIIYEFGYHFLSPAVCAGNAVQQNSAWRVKWWRECMFTEYLSKLILVTSTHSLAGFTHWLCYAHVVTSTKTLVLMWFVQEHLWMTERKGNLQQTGSHISGKLLFLLKANLNLGITYSLFSVKNNCRKVLCFRVSPIVDFMLRLRYIHMATFLPCFGNSRISMLSHHTETTFECFLHNARGPLNLVYRPFEKSKSPGKRKWHLKENNYTKQVKWNRLIRSYNKILCHENSSRC